ncbi:MAG: prepilin-type N-terminal cleavage/methylation domain-containing protein, partial [Candidatus Taylorbacteria bacterium]|nr:prepilin-type N-terminal cleavage/methylation domain-containing protein [Candidatus Taylorbacteria bacterium]
MSSVLEHSKSKPLRRSCSCSRSGFTLVELMVSIGIFVFMTALMIVKFGNFNQSILLTNLSYDIALTLRTAQTYGLSVQGSNLSFRYPYGVAFCGISSCAGSSLSGGGRFTSQQMVMFADADSQGMYNSNDIPISTYTIKNGAKVLGFCDDVNGCSDSNGTKTSIKRVDISFMRPNPDAIICTSPILSGAGVEMMVSLAIFSMVAVVALGAFAKIISANHKTQSLQSGLNNLNFALEGMSRELRAGKEYFCDTDTNSYDGSILTANGCSIAHVSNQALGVAVLAFRSSRLDTDHGGCNLANVYRFISKAGSSGNVIHIEKAEQTTCGSGVGEIDLSGNDIIAPDITITDAWIGVGSYDPTTFNISSNTKYPQTFIRLAGYVGNKEKER